MQTHIFVFLFNHLASVVRPFVMVVLDNLI